MPLVRAPAAGGECAPRQRRAAVAEPPDDWPNRERSGVIRVAGRQWHYQQAGSGEDLLLVHGTGASTHSWRDVLPRLARHRRVLAVDLPGHGFSERLDDETLSLPRMTAALAELLDALPFRPRVSVGHSAGTAVLLRLALDGRILPGTVIGLNAALLPYGGRWQPLVSPFARLCANTALLPRLLAAAARDPQAVRRMLASTGSRIDDAGIGQYRQLMRRPGHVAAVLSMMAHWQLQELLEELPRLEARLVLVTAPDDRAVRPSQAREVQRLVPGCRVVELPRGGHLVHEEAPAAVSDLLLELADGEAHC